MRTITGYIILAILPIAATGCFTGIESTPKITQADVRKENISASPEQTYLSDIRAESVADWRPGKRFYVTDRRIGLTMTSDTPVRADSLVGREIEYESVGTVPAIDGTEQAVIHFRSPDGQRLTLETHLTPDRLKRLGNYDVPFAIDTDIVERVGQRLRNHRYYITTPVWRDKESARTIDGQRHVAVDIVDVLPGNFMYPLEVVFRREGDDRLYSVYMTIGDGRTSTRNFNTLFAFDDPRKRYPGIKDEIWQLIVNSKVRPGMSKTECRLALGAPAVTGQRPTTAGMVEYWQYSEGKYLLFEDGLLSVVR